jgi:hypothetical protein
VTTRRMRAADRPLRFATMRDLETIDSELRLLAAVRRVCRELGGTVPSVGSVDELLDERSELTGS